MAGVFVIAFMKGGFGGGFAIIGIPLLALVMDPLTAGALLAPLFVAMDLCALRYWRPKTWSKPDLKLLLPGLVAGIAVGTVLLNVLDRRAVAITMALITLAFAGLWFSGGGEVMVRSRSAPKALAAGLGSGITTMVAHSGGPPFGTLPPCPRPPQGALCGNDEHILYAGQSHQIRPLALGGGHLEGSAMVDGGRPAGHPLRGMVGLAPA